MNILLWLTLFTLTAVIISIAVSFLISRLIKIKSAKRLLGFSKGMVIAIVCFDLIKNSIEYTSFLLCFLYAVLGVLFSSILIKVILLLAKSKTTNIQTALSVLLVICALGIPLGVSIGTGYCISGKIGSVCTMIIVTYNIFFNTSFLCLIKGSNIKAKITTLFIMAIPIPLSTFIGAYIGQLSVSAMSGILSFFGGVLLYTVQRDVFFKPSDNDVLVNIMGLFFGILLTVVF